MTKRTKAKTEATEAQWRDLYAAADAFKKMACWEWMDESAVFGVQSPVDGQNYFCSIMGEGGLHFGLVAYRGYQGYLVLHKLLTIEDDAQDEELTEDMMFIQDALSCTFDDREDLDKKDLAVIRSLGLKFRGRNEWPCFRDYTPGLIPWFLNGPQCVTLTHVLHQAAQVALECKKAKTTDILFGPDDELLLRVPEKTTEGLAWTSRFMHETEEGMESAEITLSDELMTQKLKKLPVRKKESWELDQFYLPMPVQDRDRPYFPRMLAIVDGEGIALSAGIDEDQHVPMEMPADELIEVLQRAGSKPQRILVKQEHLFILLGKFCEQIGIEVRLAKKLPKIAELRQGFMDFSQS